MKYKFCILISLFIILVSCNKGAIHQGMSSDEFSKSISKLPHFAYLNYCFFTDENDIPTVVTLSKDASTVESVRTFKKTSPTNEDFKKIVSGMTIYEVVELVGLPYESASFGQISMNFHASEGHFFTIDWSEENSQIKVLSCNGPYKIAS